jgi:hypothetical protein
MRHLWRYILAVFSPWVGLVSGIASVLLLVLGFIFKLSDLTQFRYWVIAAFICYAIAAFWAWYRNQPDLTIRTERVFLDRNIEGFLVTSSTSPAPQFVTIVLYQSNTRKADNAIDSYGLSVTHHGQQYQGEIAQSDMLMLQSTGRGWQDLYKLRLVPLKQGQPIEGWIRFGFKGEPNLKGCRWVLTVRDAYNTTHNVKGVLPLDFSDEIIRG